MSESIIAPKSWSAWKRAQKAGRFIRPEVFLEALEDVVGQEDMKIKLASAFSQYTLYLDDEEAGRPLVLVYGPPGSGKTYAIERLVERAGVPFTIASSAAISPPAYKGKTMTDVLIDHWQQHGTDEGVIFLDEIDKWCAGAIGDDAESKSMGIRSQAEVLKYVERDRITFIDDAKDIEELEDVVFETKRILFVFAGAFVGLDSIIRRHVTNPHFAREEIWGHAIPPDFVAYGMMGELARRVGTWAWVKPLTSTQIVAILSHQDRPRWQRRFAKLGCELALEDGALGTCAQYAIEHKTGASGASSLLRRSLDDVFTQASQHHLQRVTVDASTVLTGRVELDADARAG